MTSTLQNPQTITIAAPPTTQQVAAQLLATMASLTGTVTDYNVGSQIRTASESIGAVLEQQGIWAQAQAYQAMIYSALALFSIQPGTPVPASGLVLFSTGPSTGTSPGATQSVTIASGTITQTTGGIQFLTTAAVTLVAGASGITAPIVAAVAGTTGNVTASAITQIISSPGYPLYVSNASGTSGGSNALTAAQSLSQFAAKIAAVGLSSPVAIANAAIGVSYGSETCQYSCLFEPFIAAGSGAGSGTAGWTLYIDNGTGAASSNLIAAVTAVLNGGTNASGVSVPGGAIGYRDAGVPYAVSAVVPTYANVSVSASVASGGSATLISSAISGAVSSYFTLPFGTPAYQSQVAAAIANSVAGQITALTVSLAYQTASGTAVTEVSSSVSGRVLLGTFTQTVS